MNDRALKVLVLGARAPAALEWLRRLSAEGHQVWLADSMLLPLARLSRHCRHYVQLPPPRSQLARWAAALDALLCTEAIDWVIPTCEEAFYLSHCKPAFRAGSQIFCADFALMQQLHNKASFARLSQDWPIRAPETLIINAGSLPDAVRQVPEQWVLKPCYSRFANRTLIRPTLDALSGLTTDPGNPWLAQRFIAGTEYCSYSVLNQGELLAHSLYQPRYRAGQGSGMYFEPADDAAVTGLVQHFGRQTGYTGQVGFDFIRDQHGKFWLLECNPRATSGIHLLAKAPPLTHLFQTARTRAPAPEARPLMVALAMLSFGWPHFLKGGFWRDFLRATDVLWVKGDRQPALLQLLSFGEILLRALRQRTGLLAAATRDIEWDGQALPAITAPAQQADFNRASSAYLGLLGADQAHAIRNLRTQLLSVTVAGYDLPCSRNLTDHSGGNTHGNCYLVSPLAAYIDYARYETGIVQPTWLRRALQWLIGCAGKPLRRAGLDDTLMVNNWLLSTNLSPDHLPDTALANMLVQLRQLAPAQAIGWRSLNDDTDGALIRQLLQLGFVRVPSRQVYLFDGRQAAGRVSIRARHNNRIDQRLMASSSLQRCSGQEFSDADFVRAEQLYNLLYLEKYSPLNPHYTAQWLAAGQRDGWLQLQGLRDPNGQLVGVAGLFALGDKLTAPIVGYDTSLPQSLGLYRLLTQLCIEAALTGHQLLNFSAGAAGFKRLRGGQATIEYTLVYTRHLPLAKRLAWRILALLLHSLAMPLMKGLKL